MGFLSFVKRPIREETEEGNIRSKMASQELPKFITQDVPLLKLPPEIIHHILCHLRSPSLVSLSRTCQQLRYMAEEDILWSSFLREYIPANDFPTDPYPSSSYRDLYITHHPYWFLPKHKIWISDEPHVGKIMVCKFDPRRGCIEGYRLLADHLVSQPLRWSYRPHVPIKMFAPRVRLWLDDPILKLPHDIFPFNTRQGWWEGEIKMNVGRPGHNISASFFLSRAIPEQAQHPGTVLWPPRTIPNMPRTRGESNNNFRNREHKPQTHDQISETTFRMRHWSQFSSGLSHLGVRIGEEVSTWSTIDASLYTPTPEKPYQGIYVGDYSGHGCEFLLVMQTEKAPSASRRASVNRRFTSILLPAMGVHIDHSDSDDDSSVEDEDLSIEQSLHFTRESMPEGSAARDDESIYHGALEAVKLTGDPNIPRGEHTFIVEDIGAGGFIRFAEEEPFRGARVLRSHGHIAARGFVNDKYIPTEVMLIDHNNIAQYWRKLNHVSFYQRLDLDQLLEGTFGRRASQ